MFSSVTVLVAEGDHERAKELRHIVQAMTFTVRVVHDSYVGLSQIDKSDILILDKNLLNGSSELLLTKWVEAHRGPVCVLVDLSSGDEEQAYRTVQDLFLDGAWNILPKPMQTEVLHRILQNYACVIFGKRSAQEVSVLRRRQYVLIVIVAAALGYQFLPQMLQFLLSVI